VEGRNEDVRILINYTLDELKSATRNFRPDTVLGEGGFGRVFKGWIDKNTFKPSRVGVGIPVAVKKSNPDSLQGLQEWKVCSLLIPQDSCHSDLIFVIFNCALVFVGARQKHKVFAFHDCLDK